MKDITKRLLGKIKDIVGAIEANKLRREYLEGIIEGKGDFNVCVRGDAKRRLPEAIEDGRKLRLEYQKLAGKRYYSPVFKKYWPSRSD